MKKIIVVLMVMLVSSNSFAELDTKKVYFGGGLGLNSLSGLDFSDGLGFQFFAGYELPVKMTEGSLSAEVGYMDSGNLDVGSPFVSKEIKAKGLWLNAVYSLPLKNKLSFIGRAGLDLGDDDGLMLGAGVEFNIGESMDARLEYVIRDSVDSLQFNVVLRQ